jgi:cell division protein ZapA
MNKQIEVQIMGQSYLLGCPDDGEGPLREAVERVDAAMCKIRDAGKVKARDRIAVLASLNLAFDLVRREAQPVAAPAPLPAASALADPGPAAGPEADASESPSTDPRVAQLIHRLDQALTGDGLLL